MVSACSGRPESSAKDAARGESESAGTQNVPETKVLAAQPQHRHAVSFPGPGTGCLPPKCTSTSYLVRDA